MADFGVSVVFMAYRAHLFNALVAATAAFGSAALLSVRTHYRAAIGERFGQRLLLWSRATRKDEATNSILEMVAVVLIPTALMLALLIFR